LGSGLVRSAVVSRIPRIVPAKTRAASGILRAVHRLRGALALATLLLGGYVATASADSLQLRRVGVFDAPVYVTAPPGDESRLFVVQRGGSVVVLRNGRRAGTFLEVDTTTDCERGLLSIAFAPDYAESGLVYAYYTDAHGDTRVDELKVSAADPDRVDPASQRNVLLVRQPECNHNGGQLQFGPDGLLYVGLGDGGGGGDQHGSRGNGQDLGSLLGKLLRIDPRASGGRPYTAPADNPFAGVAGARPEIWSYGLRNPWRFSFDRASGGLTIGDVGQDTVEEVDFEPAGQGAGKNFGWRPYEGRNRLYPDEPAPGAVGPSIQHTHAAGWCSIVGGYVVRDASLPALRGRYVYGDLCRPRLYSARLRPGRARGDRPLGVSVRQLVSFGEDAAGRVYAVSLDGPVYRLRAR
jgi:glucose/arabinose dehydrogenase